MPTYFDRSYDGATVTYVPVSGDTTGVTDTALINAAIALNGIARLGAGTYTITAGSITPNGSQSIVGQSSATTIINVHGTGDGIRWTNSAFSGSSPTGEMRNFTIQPDSSSTTTTNGIHWGDIRGARFWDVYARNFVGATASNFGFGIWGDNQLSNGNGERCSMVDVEVQNNTVGVGFDFHNGQNSFDYSYFDIRFTINAPATNAQTAVALLDGANLYHTTLRMKGNVGTGSTTPVAISLAGGARLTNSDVHIQAESANSGNCTNISIDATSVWQANTGIIDFSTTNASFTANLTAGYTFSTSLMGRVLGNGLSGGMPQGVGLPTGWWYPNYAITLGTIVLVTGRVYAYPFWLTTAHSFQAIGTNVTAAGTSPVVRFGVYNDNGSGTPNSLLVDTGTVNISGTGSLTSNNNFPLVLNPGLYWLAVCQVSATAAATVNADTSARGSLMLGQANPGGGASQSEAIGWSTTGTSNTGALPSTFPASTLSTTGIALVTLES